MSLSFADDASQTSRSSLSGSLLDRIRAQRDKETSARNDDVSLPFPSDDDNRERVIVNESDPVSMSWLKDFNFLRNSEEYNDAAESLLGDDLRNEQYSMWRYFKRFIHDCYSGFRSLNPFFQCAIVCLLLLLAIWLLRTF
jgi:hypothetical protein